ncbi:RICIN domain-containing protein [Actinoplanes missouriensis]|uniref:RICIN domain-containing protein n=1 Tax=Actinoplanes missouriensis TaxID=1866 RepID=UPI003400A165
MRRLVAPIDERGSMPMAMVVMIVGVSLSALLTTMVLSRIQSGVTSSRQLLALHAAQAGLDVALAHVRGAVSTDDEGEESGDRTLLPCDPMTGAVGAGNAGTYRVEARYYLVDPQGKSDTWRSENMISCPSGGAPQEVPAYARFTAVGTYADKDGTVKRKLNGTYILHTTNANIYGGLVHSNGTVDLCIAAESGDPAVGSAVTMQPCKYGAVAQTWAYDNLLKFVLISSQKPARPSGMCLDAGAQATGTAVVMQPCQDTKPSLYRQQWSFNDNSQLVGAKLADGSDVSSNCFRRTPDNTVGASIVIATSSCSSWAPDSAVGAGMANSPTGGQAIGQLVNYAQFGRCLDATNKKPDWPHMIAWPCKQNPNPANVTWNQRYTLPALDSTKEGKANNYVSGPITTTVPATKTDPAATYCLESPGSVAVGQYVRTVACTGSTLFQNWTVYGQTDRYATSYQIVDGSGKYCLQPRSQSASPTDYFNATNQVAKIYVGVCDGSTLQKWNADKNVIAALALKDVDEDESPND